MNNLLSSLQEDGFPIARVSSTDGGEYAGACPWCGGKDRFRVWPDEGLGGKYWCRQCGEQGDLADYLEKKRGMTRAEALFFARGSKSEGTEPVKDEMVERQNSELVDPEAWEKAARAFMGRTEVALQSSFSDRPVVDITFTKKRQWLLEERGLKEDAVIKNGLGYSPRSIYADRRGWGLSEKLKNDKPVKLVIPAGLYIPILKDGRLVGIRIRRDEPWKNQRYGMVPGSRPVSMIYGTGENIMIVESDLDAMLIAQEAGDLVRVVALGSAAILPNKELINEMATVPRVLLSLDRDNAGTKGMVNLVEMLPNAYACLAPGAKDITESWKKHNIDVRKVVLAGLQSKKNKL